MSYKTTQARLDINNKLYLAIKIDHAATDIKLDDKDRSVTMIVPTIDGVAERITRSVMGWAVGDNYSIVGEYKYLEDKQKKFRDYLTSLGLNIDENLLIIRKL